MTRARHRASCGGNTVRPRPGVGLVGVLTTTSMVTAQSELAIGLELVTSSHSSRWPELLSGVCAAYCPGSARLPPSGGRLSLSSCGPGAWAQEVCKAARASPGEEPHHAPTLCGSLRLQVCTAQFITTPARRKGPAGLASGAPANLL